MFYLLITEALKLLAFLTVAFITASPSIIRAQRTIPQETYMFQTAKPVFGAEIRLQAKCSAGLSVR